MFKGEGMKRIVPITMLMLLLMAMLLLALNIKSTKAEWTGTVYIRADGSIDPPDAPIVTYDNVTYTLTGNITSTADGIVVERDNITIDGAMYTVRGTGEYPYKGIDLTGRSNVTIKNTRLTAFFGGIVSGSCDIKLLDNTITNSYTGIYIGNSFNNFLRRNKMFGNRFNFCLWVSGWDECHDIRYYIHDIDTSNLVDNKPIYYWVNRYNATVPMDAGYVALVNCTNITVNNLDLRNNAQGVLLASTSNSLIVSNRIENNSRGISAVMSFYNSFFDNTITDNSWDGIYLLTSYNNTLSYNEINNNYDGIGLECSDYNLVSNNIIINNTEGIYAGESSTKVLGNTITGNKYGISLLGLSGITSHPSIVSNNVISNSQYGIDLTSSSDNKIYHNNFLNNTNQTYDASWDNPNCPPSVNVWDDDYPSGGNYWSDYTDVDLNNDGIWDHPYVIDTNNQDRYPLVNPWTPTLKITSIDPSQPIVCSGRQWLTILGEGFVPDTEVTLFYGSEIYHVPRDRTWYIDPSKIEVLVGLAAKGQWKVWVTNPDGVQSNEYTFQVRGFTKEDCEKVAALAIQYWDPKNAAIMAAIAAAESNLNPNVGGDYGTYTKWDEDPNFRCAGYPSWGLWQIYMPSHKSLLQRLGAPTYDPYMTARWLSNPQNNAKAAHEIWKNEGFEAWSTYKPPEEEYKKFLGMFERIILAFKSPVNITITDNYGRMISEIENQIPGASFEYFEITGTKIFYLPLNLTYNIQLHAVDYGNCTIDQITPTESMYETVFSQLTFNLTNETIAEFNLLLYNANYTLKVDENGDGEFDYELTPEIKTMTTEYDIGVTEIVPSKTIVGQGYNLPINVSIMNYGAYTETFNITFYANTTSITSQVITLLNGTSITITFAWNTTGLDKGNYTISAYAWPIYGETEIGDNNMTSIIQVHVGVPGNVYGNPYPPPVYDDVCNMRDVTYLILHFNTKPGSPNWDPNADVNNDGICNMRDITIAILNFNKHE